MQIDRWINEQASGDHGGPTLWDVGLMPERPADPDPNRKVVADPDPQERP